MNPAILERLRQSNQPRDWENILQEFRQKPVAMVGTEPVYEFFYTFDESLEINSHSIGLSVQPVASYIPFHIHDYVEMTIPLLGECQVVTKNEKITVTQNDIIIIGNHTTHRVEPISESAIVVNLTLKGSAFSLNDFEFMHQGKNTQGISSMLFSLLSNENLGEGTYSLFHTQQDPKIIDTVYDILHEYFHPDTQTNQIIRFEILTLFSRLLRVATKNQAQLDTGKKATTNLLSLLLYIEKNYSQITLEQMAKDFSFNPNYLSGYLKKHTGYTFIKLVHWQRINAAAEYLTYTNVPIEQIALKVGYENPSYFYKIFRKSLGLSPKEYREQNRGEAS